MNIFGDVICVYTREQAIEDGVLIDVSETAKEAGFNCPVAVTAQLWSMITTIPEACSFQDKVGRLWDVLCLAAIYAKSSNSSIINYKLSMDHEVENEKGKRILKNLELKAIAGPGDNGELVITIMLPYED